MMMAAAVSAVSASTPADIYGASLLGWHDISDTSSLFIDSAGTTPVTTDGDPVGRVVNQVAGGPDLTQSSDTAWRATYRTANGKSWLEFTGVERYNFSGITLGDDLTIAIGARYTDTSIQRMLIGSRNGDFQKLGVVSASRDFFWRAVSGGSAIDTDVSHLNTDSAFVGGRSGSSLIGRLDGAQVGSTSTSTSSTSFNLLGGAYDDATEPEGNRFVGRIYSVIIASAYSQGQSEDIESYLASLMG